MTAALLAWIAVAGAQDVPEAPTCPEGRGFPGEAWPEAMLPAAAVADLEAYLFPAGLDRADKDRAGIRTDGFVVIHRGELVYERYTAPYGPEVPHLAWSATKTFTNALIGIAVGGGRIELDDTICERLDGTSGDACKVTVKDLLEFASGFDWRETYEGESPTTSSVIAMLYGEGRHDMARFVAAHPVRDPPGTTWSYSSGDTNVLAAIAGAALAPEHGERFPWAVLFDPIGMRDVTWERDGAGTYVGSSYLWAPPRQLARFGYLWLADGCWDGERILPEGWVEASTAVNEPIRKKAYGRDDGDVQGRQVWLNRTVPEQGQTELPWPDVPEGAYAAQGHWKQRITVIPTLDLVVVRTGDDRDDTYSDNEALKRVIAMVRER